MAKKRPRRTYPSIVRFMEATGYTQEDVGRLCHLSQSSVSRIIKGQRGVSLKTAIELSRLTGVKIERFM